MLNKVKKVILRLRKLSCFNSRLDGAPLVDWLTLQIPEKKEFTERRKKHQKSSVVAPQGLVQDVQRF